MITEPTGMKEDDCCVIVFFLKSPRSFGAPPAPPPPSPQEEMPEATANASTASVLNCVNQRLAVCRQSVASVDSKGIVKCRVSNEKFSTLEEIFEHLRGRRSPCGKLFKCNAQFTSHVCIHGCQLIQTNSLPRYSFWCKVCRKVCTSQAQLKKHVELSICPRCGYLQQCQTLLAEHLSLCDFMPPQY
jgi:Zinc-finger of C2H2 type